VWRWDQQEPFGVNVPDENPSGLGTFEFPLRFPGQYFDRETNQHYNGFRDLDPILDRYGRADPLGVLTTQGPTSTTKLNHLYVYANANPLSSTDPSGLLSPLQHAGIFLEAFGGTGFSDAFAWQVAREAVKFDFMDGSQSIELAHTHGMTPLGGDPFSTQAATASFINYQMRLCTPQGLGWALHAAQDKHARGHSGYREYGGLLRFEIIFHTILMIGSRRKKTALPQWRRAGG